MDARESDGSNGHVVVPRMHEKEVEIDEGLVRRLVDEQVPDLAHLALARIDAWGTDHAIFRLGDEWSVRLPKIGWAADQGEHEARWLPLLAPRLPVEIPVPRFVGTPASGYPFAWYVSPWLKGANPGTHGSVDRCQLARELAEFVLALQSIDTSGAPAPWYGSGDPFSLADAELRERADELRGETDVDGLLAAWAAASRGPRFAGSPVWVHGDLLDGNLLVRDGRLTGVIDWGGVADDPATDLMIAWSYFDTQSREVYREALGFVDDAMWLRGRAFAVVKAIHALPYYRDTNPDIVARSWRTVEAVLADLESG